MIVPRNINETNLDNVTLIRTGEDSVEIRWSFGELPQTVTIYAGTSPDQIDRRHPVSICREVSIQRVRAVP